jgi:hypothetical protein
MKRFAIMFVSATFAAAALHCEAEPVCTQVTVQDSVGVVRPALTLAALLSPGTCPQLLAAAEQVSLGAVPRPGSVRVFDGRQVRRLLAGLTGGELTLKKLAGVQIPERILVQRAGATKSCAEIARFIASVATSQNGTQSASRWQEDVNCAAAQGIPKDAPLELTKSAWSPALQRWEFALRCARPEDCVPFLVWVREKATAGQVAKAQDGTVEHLTFWTKSSSRGVAEAGLGNENLVKRGQTATLTWDEAGIRVVLPVTCLDTGGLGQFVRVRLQNATRILQAEVVGEGTLRAHL